MLFLTSSENHLHVESVNNLVLFVIKLSASLSSDITSNFSEAIQKRINELQQNNPEIWGQFTVSQHLVYVKDFLKLLTEILQGKLEVLGSKANEVQELKKQITELEGNIQVSK